MATMQEAKVPFEMAVYPGKTHTFAGPNIPVHLYGTMLRFLERNRVAPGHVGFAWQRSR